MKCRLFNPKIRKWTSIIILAWCALNFAGCELLGPSVLRRGRSDHNEAIKITDVEQLLLSIVLSLKAGGVPADSPVLTLPVGR
jgi:hypothetical protein